MSFSERHKPDNRSPKAIAAAIRGFTLDKSVLEDVLSTIVEFHSEDPAEEQMTRFGEMNFVARCDDFLKALIKQATNQKLDKDDIESLKDGLLIIEGVKKDFHTSIMENRENSEDASDLSEDLSMLINVPHDGNLEERVRTVSVQIQLHRKRQLKDIEALPSEIRALCKALRVEAVEPQSP